MSDINTLLLSHFDGTGQTFVDETGNATLIASNASSFQTTDEFKFGSSSLFVSNSDQQSGVYSVGDGVTTFGENDFTIDFWVYNTVLSGYHTFVSDSNVSSLANQFWIGALDTRFRLAYGNSSTYYETALGVLSTNQWHHIAVVKNGSLMQGYVDGILQISNTSASFNYVTDALYLGYVPWGPHDMNGYIDELRISDIARYTENFTPPTEAYGSEGGSPLLCWSLTGRYSNGRLFSLQGPDSFPGLTNLSIPQSVLADSITVIEDGSQIEL